MINQMLNLLNIQIQPFLHKIDQIIQYDVKNYLLLLMEEKQTNEKQKDQLHKAFEEFGNETPLNLTDEANDDPQDPQTAAKIQQQYEKFMSQMKNLNFDEAGEGMQGLGDSLSGLLKGLTQSLGMQGPQGQEMKKMFQGTGGGENFQDLAGKLLDVFMKKQLLYAPLLQCKTSYEDYFKKEQGKIPEQDHQRYRKQYSVISEIIEILDKNPEQKEKLIELFEKLQDFGQPPTGIASVTLPGHI